MAAMFGEETRQLGISRCCADRIGEVEKTKMVEGIRGPWREGGHGERERARSRLTAQYPVISTSTPWGPLPCAPMVGVITEGLPRFSDEYRRSPSFCMRDCCGVFEPDLEGSHCSEGTDWLGPREQQGWGQGQVPAGTFPWAGNGTFSSCLRPQIQRALAEPGQEGG